MSCWCSSGSCRPRSPRLHDTWVARIFGWRERSLGVPANGRLSGRPVTPSEVHFPSGGRSARHAAACVLYGKAGYAPLTDLFVSANLTRIKKTLRCVFRKGDVKSRGEACGADSYPGVG